MKESEQSLKGYGGIRKNSGRKNTGETIPSVVMRVPEVLKDRILTLIRCYKNSSEYKVKTKKFDIKIDQKAIIIFYYWKEKSQEYEKRYLLRKVVSVKESYFETEKKWRFKRVGDNQCQIFERVCSEYRKIVKQYGKPSSVIVEKYNFKRHRYFEFL